MSLLLTLASDPYDPPALDALASALRGGRGSSSDRRWLRRASSCRRGPCRSRTTSWCGRSGTPKPTIWWTGTWQRWSGRPLVRRAGRPKALSVEQAEKLVKAAADELPDGGGGARGPRPLHAYVVLLLTTGLRPEEAQALCWESRRSRRVDGRGVALGQGPRL